MSNNRGDDSSYSTRPGKFVSKLRAEAHLASLETTSVSRPPHVSSSDSGLSSRSGPIATAGIDQGTSWRSKSGYVCSSSNNKWNFVWGYGRPANFFLQYKMENSFTPNSLKMSSKTCNLLFLLLCKFSLLTIPLIFPHLTQGESMRPYSRSILFRNCQQILSFPCMFRFRLPVFRAKHKVHNFPHLTERAYFPALNRKCIIFRAQDRPHVFPPLSSSFTWAPLLALCYFVLNRPLNKKKCGGFTPVKLTFCALVLRRRRA